MPQTGAAPTGKWEDVAVWAGEGLRREVFFFGPPGARLYGSLYSAAAPSRSHGVVVCSSWGYEADRVERLAHHIALTAARQGGGGMVFHYPGYGDSHGAPLAEATLDGLAAAAGRALEEAARRLPQLTWFPAGLMIGAAVAFLAARSTPVAADELLLVQPALSPSEYFGRLAKSAKRVSLGPGRVEDMSFGYPLPLPILEAGEEADRPVVDAIGCFDGGGAVVRYADSPVDDAVPGRLADRPVEGSWRFGMKDYPALEEGVAEWLAG